MIKTSIIINIFLSVFIFTVVISAQQVNGEKNKSRPKATLDQKFQGAVILRIIFLASGQIGEVEVISGLSDEINRQAVDAARKIKFEPAVKNGAPVSITKKVEYTFYTDYEENDSDLQSVAEIVKKPLPDYPKDSNLGKMSGKVNMKIALRANGRVEINEIKSDLPQEFKDKAREMALKIKFNPAISKDGRKVSQIKEIEYEFKPKNN